MEWPAEPCQFEGIYFISVERQHTPRASSVSGAVYICIY